MEGHASEVPSDDDTLGSGVLQSASASYFGDQVSSQVQYACLFM